MNNIFFTSDLHFCHDKGFLYEPRGYNSIWEMNENIISNWNDMIKWNDTVYILGDLMLCNNQAGMNYLRRLNGNLKIIIGNHDTDTRLKLYKELYNVEILGYATMQKINGYRFYISHYPTLCGNIGEEDISLKRKTINLCGHTHTKNRFCDWDKGIIYHCELDAHENKPVPIETIITDLQHYSGR